MTKGEARAKAEMAGWVYEITIPKDTHNPTDEEKALIAELVEREYLSNLEGDVSRWGYLGGS